ncbi:MAG: hypothetical protein M3Y22_15670 [Pseudomonadota bacterium]|nr:hypothetical protein [Pseudomonadota bacterium]
MSNPALTADERQALVDDLMRARREIASAKRRNDPAALSISQEEVDRLKHALGERGKVWWTDGAEEVNQRMARNTAYAVWFAAIEGNG